MNSVAKFLFKKSINILILLIAGTSSMAKAKDQTEFVWLATESAPHNFPMQIMRGSSFIYHGSESEGLYIPSGGTLYRGWGSAISSHVVGPDLKPLPHKLDITFYSYLEDTFYSGTFDLPHDKILNIFRQGVAEDKANPTYRYVMVGIAPGGTVAVWVTGKQSTVEVFFGKAQKAAINWSKAIDYPEEDREEFIKLVVDGSVKPDILAIIRKNGIPFDQWAKYRTKYHWAPNFVGGEPKNTGISYFNGEGNKRVSITDATFINATHPVPAYFAFHFQIPGQAKKDLFIVNFDEAEMLAAFAKLGSNLEQLHLEFTPALPKPNTKIRLYNDKESIQLTRWKVDVW